MSDVARPAPAPPTAPPAHEMVTITVDGQAVPARKGEMLIAAAERAGVYIPRFCYHPRMRPVGVCRMCLVEVKGPRGFALMPSCYVPAADGAEIVTNSEKVRKAQDGVLEFLLMNHPLDCPVCDRGGECPLQDQTFAFGPGESRFIEEKRHWAKPIPINPLVALDRERCIQCSRCTRFAAEVAGDAMIDFVGRADATEINTFPDRPFTSNFSGNIVQICPVGALTAAPYRFRARPWDLETVESTCTGCSVGCRIAIQSSSDQIIRHLGVDSEPVNHGWLCDKGRFGYEAGNHPDRLTQPLLRRGGTLVEATWSEALDAAAAGLARIVDAAGPTAVAVLGGARLANEDAYAWARLAKGVIGTDNVDAQMGDGLPPELVLGLPRATIDEACGARAVVLLAPDIKEELAVLYLRLREAAVDHKLAMVEITPAPTGLSRYAAVSLVHRPGEAHLVAEALAGATTPTEAAGGVEAADLARAHALVHAATPTSVAPGPADSTDSASSSSSSEASGPPALVLVLGRPSLAEPAGATVAAATALVEGLAGLRILPALRRGNVHGALDMGLAPGLLPGRVSLSAGGEAFDQAWGTVPAASGLDAAGILAGLADQKVQGLVLLGADPLSDFPDRQRAQAAMDGAGFVVAVDTFLTASSSRADVVLPAAAAGERTGTTTNIEGRVTRLGQKVTPPGSARTGWSIAAELARRLGSAKAPATSRPGLDWDTVDEVTDEIASLAPSWAGLSWRALSAAENRDGVVGPVLSGPMPSGPDSSGSAPPTTPAVSWVPAPATTSVPTIDGYSLRLVAGRAFYDAGVATSHSPSLAPLAPGPRLRVNPANLDALGVGDGGTVRLSTARAAMEVEVAADPGLPRGSAYLAFNQAGVGVADLLDSTDAVTDVRIATIAGSASTGATSAGATATGSATATGMDH
ncbi:MAG: NADH-quinone oxidoreductase subunit NuoG [Acidimicrobiales bacterium]